MKDLTIDPDYKRGAKGANVRLIQEWLSLHGFGVVPDGKFGAATEAAVRAFQRKKRIPADGSVDEATFEALVKPMHSALKSPKLRGSLGAMIVAYAKRHLRAHPREVGGENRGPWVRLYMGGREGAEFAWCAGFACFVLQQACSTLQLPLPITTSVSCDSLAASAKRNGIFVRESAATRSGIRAGSFFLVRRSPEDWTHVGVVTAVAAEAFSTIEGNTNDSGSREGFEVCARTRGYKDKDFIVF